MRRRPLGLLLAGALLSCTTPVLADAGPSSRTLIFASVWGANHVTVSDATTFREIAQIPSRQDGPAVLVPTADGRKVYLENGGPDARTVGVLDTRSLQLTRQIEMAGVQGDRATRIQRDGRYYYYSSIPDNTVVQVDTRTDQVTRTYPGIGNDFTVARDGRTLFTFGSGSMKALDVRTGATVGEVSIPDTGVPLATAGFGWTFMSEDGTQVVHAANPTQFIDVRDRTRMRVLGSVPTGAFPLLGDMSPDGRWLWLPNGDDGTLSVIDLRQRRLVRTLQVGRYMTYAGFSPDGRTVYVARARAGSPKPFHGMTAALYFGQMGGGGIVRPREGQYYSQPGLDTPGEIAAYDARTFRELPLKPVPTVTVPVYLSAVSVPR